MASTTIIVASIAWTILGIVIAVAAARFGRPFWPWLIYSIAFWPLAFLHLIFVKHRIRDAGPLEEDE